MAMDKIYLPKNISPIIKLSQRFAEFRSDILSFPGLDARHISAETALNWPSAENSDAFAELDASVSLDQLGSPHDLRIRPYNPKEYRPVGLSRLQLPKRALQTLRTLSSLYGHSQIDSRKRSGQIPKKPYNHQRVNYDRDVDVTSSTLTSDINPGDELLVVVRIYEPFKYAAQTTTRKRLRLKQRITLLGSQTLDEFRDLIHCTCTQHGPFHDISDRPRDSSSAEAPPTTSSSRLQSHSDPGFFFITDTFYTDDRDSTHAANDCIQPIRQWAAQHPDQVGAFTPRSLTMQQTRWLDVRLRIGAPHVYQHYGNCEHVFTVSDVRLISATGDSRMRRDYPLVDMVQMGKKLMCSMCGIADAQVVVMDSVLHVQDPAFLCNSCFETCHYIDGTKVGEFRAYSYMDNRKASDEFVVKNEVLSEQV